MTTKTTTEGKAYKWKPENDSPYVDKMTPEIILKVHRIFNPKYEDEASNNCSVDEKQQS